MMTNLKKYLVVLLVIVLGVSGMNFADVMAGEVAESDKLTIAESASNASLDRETNTIYCYFIPGEKYSGGTLLLESEDTIDADKIEFKVNGDLGEYVSFEASAYKNTFFVAPLNSKSLSTGSGSFTITYGTYCETFNYVIRDITNQPKCFVIDKDELYHSDYNPSLSTDKNILYSFRYENKFYYELQIMSENGDLLPLDNSQIELIAMTDNVGIFEETEEGKYAVRPEGDYNICVGLEYKDKPTRENTIYLRVNCNGFEDGKIAFKYGDYEQIITMKVENDRLLPSKVTLSEEQLVLNVGDIVPLSAVVEVGNVGLSLDECTWDSFAWQFGSGTLHDESQLEDELIFCDKNGNPITTDATNMTGVFKKDYKGEDFEVYIKAVKSGSTAVKASMISYNGTTMHRSVSDSCIVTVIDPNKPAPKVKTQVEDNLLKIEIENLEGTDARVILHHKNGYVASENFIGMKKMSNGNWYAEVEVFEGMTYEIFAYANAENDSINTVYDYVTIPEAEKEEIIPTPTPTPTPEVTPTPLPTPTPTPLPENTYYLGDVDMDGVVEAGDALEILKHVVKLSELSGNPLKLADVDENNAIEASDALETLKVVVKLSEKQLITIE